MCPDESLLSAYIDGEVPSPWKEKMESHFGACPVCSTRLAEFRKLDAGLQELLPSDVESELAAARARIEADLRFDLADAVQAKTESIAPKTRTSRRMRESRNRSGMARKVAIPMPVLAASFFVLIFAAGLLIGGKVLVGNKPQSMASASSASGTIQVGSGSMDSINQYWASLKSDQGVTITMPSEVSFEPIGDPVIMTYTDGASAATVVSPASSGTVPTTVAPGQGGARQIQTP
jgi:hypothetical protein